MFERPTTTASRPASEACTVLVSIMQPSGVQGTSEGMPLASFPTFSGVKPSTSLAGEIAFRMRVESICAGNGNCTRMPSILRSALSVSTNSSSSVSLVVAGSLYSNEAMPISTVARALLRT